MSTDESSHLEFRGTDLKECEQFIASIKKHARAQGKFRDDQWIADFVAVCLIGDALTAWSLLDEETQGSWRLLRQAMISRFRPLFFGKSGTKAEDFVHQVRQRALHVGKLNDQRWIAEFASGCFVGSALGWYTSLESGVRDDWVSLQAAILRSTARDLKRVPPIVTVTAATAPVAPTDRRRGRIRVFREGDSAIYYLSKVLGLEPAQHGRLLATTSVADALEVECESLRASDGPQNLLIPDNQIPGFDVLGIKCCAAAGDRSFDNYPLAICGVKSTSGAATLGSPFDGPTLMKSWNVAQSEDHRISISVLYSGFGDRLHFFSGAGGNRSVWFRLKKKAPTDLDSDLLFEPI